MYSNIFYELFSNKPCFDKLKQRTKALFHFTVNFTAHYVDEATKRRMRTVGETQ